jgi:NAD(P)-dependent dehydrogenase (short-subunit alcohol dehydrogenase family)
MRLGGKMGMVTGSSRDLGKAIAFEQAREGSFVIVTAKTNDGGQSPLL